MNAALATPRRVRYRLLAVLGLLALAAACSTLGRNQADGSADQPAAKTTKTTKSTKTTKADGSAVANGEDTAEEDQSDEKASASPSGPVTLTPPPGWDPARLAGEPTAVPSDPPCNQVVRSGQSIQDAIDAVADRVTPYVLCVDGVFQGGNSPASLNRPGIGPYFGGITIAGRQGFTLRGLPGSVINAIPNDDVTPDESAPPDAQSANDKAILVKVVNSSRVTLEGLTIEGLVGGQAVLNRLVWFQHVTDSTIRFNVIHDAGGECVRIKTNSQRNEIHHNEIAGCGIYQFTKQKEQRLRKNGEGIYIGTDPAQIATTQVNKQRWFGLDATLVTDRSSFNWVHHNRIAPGPPDSGYGNECVDIKEDWPAPQSDRPGDVERGLPGHNLVSDNECSGQFDPESGAFDSRGPFNTFEHNRVFGDVEGAALRIGASEKDIGDDSVDWKALGNRVRLNRLESFGYEFAVKAWKDQPLANGEGVCGNVDASGRALTAKLFANDEKAAKNVKTCPDTRAPAGPRGSVGPPPR